MIDPIVESVRQKLFYRSQVGMNKYGTDMTRKDLSILDWHRHHLEELLDAAVYTERIIWELEDKK